MLTAHLPAEIFNAVVTGHIPTQAILPAGLHLLGTQKMASRRFAGSERFAILTMRAPRFFGWRRNLFPDRYPCHGSIAGKWSTKTQATTMRVERRYHKDWRDKHVPPSA